MFTQLRSTSVPRDVDLRALDGADVGAVKARTFTERLLGQTPLGPERGHLASDASSRWNKFLMPTQVRLSLTRRSASDRRRRSDLFDLIADPCEQGSRLCN